MTTKTNHPTSDNIDQPPPLTNPAVDPFAYLGMIFNSDGSITRKGGILYSHVVSNTTPSSPVLTKDISLNKSNNTWLRLYIPHETLDSTSKLPLIVYYHGGGFIIGSVTTPVYNNFCKTLAIETPAIVLSVEYRLAPEHRLPAAYHDSMEALHWIKALEDEWLTKYGDVSNCYLMGTSAGANIAYHAATFLDSVDLKPLRIRGLILHQVYFGGIQRTKSEQRLVDDNVLPLNVNDIMWELSLPVGADRDHEYSNLTVGIGARSCDQIKMFAWKVLVTGCEGDPLMDRQVELVNMMKEKGVEVVSKFDEGDYHSSEVFDPAKGQALRLVIRNFIVSI